jgi:hypothetical protein
VACGQRVGHCLVGPLQIAVKPTPQWLGLKSANNCRALAGIAPGMHPLSFTQQEDRTYALKVLGAPSIDEAGA